MIRGGQCQHLTKRQRTAIRNSAGLDVAIAEHYGVSVATVRLVRNTTDHDHPARIAAVWRRYSATPPQASLALSMTLDDVLEVLLGEEEP